MIQMVDDFFSSHNPCLGNYKMTFKISIILSAGNKYILDGKSQYSAFVRTSHTQIKKISDILIQRHEKKKKFQNV